MTDLHFGRQSTPSIQFSSPKEYDDYFINQLGELLTNYGKIDYLWFDDCGSLMANKISLKP